jgi:two-component system nitrogen regulation response regulator GlnG
VLLDEVGDVPTNLQVKLLRAIEHREVTPVGDARPRPTDIRVIAATNQPLAELMASGRFRGDLFFRLSVFQIHIPPLRERREDIPALAEHFLGRSRLPDVAGSRLTDEALDELRSRPWVGNIRELRNTIEHAAIVARGRPIRAEHLPPPATGTAAGMPTVPGISEEIARWAGREARTGGAEPVEPPLYERFLDLVEPPLLRAVLERCRGNRAAAALTLGIHRATLRQKLRKYGLG